MRIDPSRLAETAREAAEAGARAALKHWRSKVAVDVKPDRSPVTAADRDSEEAIIARIRREHPDHALLTEESGAIPGAPGARWIVDPLDGTRGFVRGGAFWGPLVAFQVEGEIVAGAMVLPVLEETYWAARGAGAWRGEQRLRIGVETDPAAATLSLGEMRALLGSPSGPGVARLISTAASVRCYGDLAAAAMLLTGQADAWLEAGVKLWDLAAPRIVLEEAGATFTDLDGRPSLAHGSALAANPALHDALLRLLG
jgi:histidinol-phosphatase